MAPSQRRTVRTQNVSFTRSEISHPTTQEILENRRQLGTRKQYSASIKRVITAMGKVVDREVPEGQELIPEISSILQSVKMDFRMVNVP